MKVMKFAIVPMALISLAACQDKQEPTEADVAADRIAQMEQGSVIEADGELVALGMTEADLKEASLVDSKGRDLGDIEGVRNNAEGIAENLVVELDGSDRQVLVPVEGLKSRIEAEGTSIETAMTAEELSALPDAPAEQEAEGQA